MLARTPLKLLPKSSTGWIKALTPHNLTPKRFYHSGVDNFSITSGCKLAIEKFLIPNGK
jgi:Fe-S cluster assembly iron-binding protein IscA